jgi:hypothetical protein
MQATEFSTPDYDFYQLNELPKGAKEILKSLAVRTTGKAGGLKDCEPLKAVY